MPIWLSIIVTVLADLAKAWFATQQASTDAQQLGATKAENNAEQVAVQAVQASDAVKPLTAAELPSHNPSNDPDFRD